MFSSLIGSEAHYDVMVELLKETVEDWKENLEGFDLSFAELQRATLMVANLKNAKLFQVNLQGAWLQEADLRRSILEWADLKGAVLQGAKLQEANLKGANLKGAYFYGARLQGAKGLTLKMLLEVKTLYSVLDLEPELAKELIHKKPELFEKPKE